jgi:hypothetical protein
MVHISSFPFQPFQLSSLGFIKLSMRLGQKNSSSNAGLKCQPISLRQNSKAAGIPMQYRRGLFATLKHPLLLPLLKCWRRGLTRCSALLSMDGLTNPQGWLADDHCCGCSSRTSSSRCLVRVFEVRTFPEPTLHSFRA